MSSLVTPVNGDIVTVSVHKHLISNPGAIWSNTYDFKILLATSGTLFTGITETCLEFERLITLNTTHFDEVRVSTFLPDSRPYNPEAFITTPVDVVGHATPDGEPEPLGFAWLVIRNTGTGRPGKLFLRAALTEGSVFSSGGLPAFSDAPGLRTFLAAQVTASGLSDYMDGTSPDAKLVVAHYNKTTHAVTSRDISSFTSRGPILAKLSKRRKRSITLHTGG